MLDAGIEASACARKSTTSTSTSILFLIFINDLPEICATEQDTVMYLYADDAKVYSTITRDKDHHLHLQKVIDHIKEWCDQWLLPLNINKCSHLSYTSRLSIDTAYYINNTDQSVMYKKLIKLRTLEFCMTLT